MKKLLFIVINLLFCFDVVYATNHSELVAIVNKCSILNDNSVLIPVKVISKNNGLLTSVIDEYTLGNVDNIRDKMNIKITNIKGDNVENVLVNPNRDSDNRSLVNYYISEDIKTNKLEEVMSFNIEVEFIDEDEKSLYILGNEVVVSEDEEVCRMLNGYEITEVERIKYVDLNQVDHKNFIDNIISNIVIGILIIVIVVLFILLIKSKK